MVINNYKKMCELLGEDIKSGNAKISQMKEWECYFAYERNKYKFIITKIYNSPKPKEDKRVKQSVYIKFIELMLMYELSQKRNNTCSYTKTFLFYLLGMVNQNYLPINRKDVLQNIKHYNIHHWQIEHFTSRCNDKLTTILFQALNSMKRRRLLDWEEQRIITEQTQNGDDVLYKTRIATKDENDFIRIVEKTILNEMEFNVVPFKISDREKYYKRVGEELYNLRGWVKTYKEYELSYYSPHLIKDIPKVKNEIMKIINDNKFELNELILNSINQQARNKYYNNLSNVEKAKNEAILNYADIWFGGKPPVEMIIENAKTKAKNNGEKNPFFEMPEDYIENQLVLANIFIDIKSEELMHNQPSSF